MFIWLYLTLLHSAAAKVTGRKGGREAGRLIASWRTSHRRWKERPASVAVEL